MKSKIRLLAALAAIAPALMAPVLRAADAALVYNKNYQCGKEIIQVSRCRRDSDTPDLPPTVDADNFCQVYYLDRPKNGMGGTAFGIELRSELEQRLRGCGALGVSQAAAPPVAKPATARTAQAPQAAGSLNAATAEFEKGKAFAKQKSYAQAIEAFREALRLNPASARYHSELGNVYYELKRYQDAIAEKKEALRLDPANAVVAHDLGIVYGALKKHPEAVASYQRAVELKPGNAVYHASLADALLGMKKYDESMAAYRESLRLDPNDAIARHGLGAVLRFLNRNEEAVSEFRKAVSLKPGNVSYLEILGYTLLKLGRIDEARKVQAELLPLDRVKAGQLQATIDKAVPATSTPTAPQSTVPRTAESEIARGQKLYGSRDYKGAIAAFQAAIPLTPDAVVAARAFRWIGASCQELKNDDKAIEALRESLRLNPKDAVAHNLLGNVHHSRKDYPNAITAYQESVRLAPGNAANRLNLGVAQVDAGQDESALANLRESLRLDPKDARAWNMLGVALTNLYEDGDALPAFREAARLEPKSGNYQFNLGSTLVALLRLDEAGKVLAVLQPLDKALALELKAQIHRIAPPTPGSSN